MMSDPTFSQDDRQQLAGAGISIEEAERQLAILRRPPRKTSLDRACRIGDGILQLGEARRARYQALWPRLQSERRLAKFVPASGAATRMFRDLSELQGLESSDAPERNDHLADLTDRFYDSIEQFAFYPALLRALADRGESLPDLIAQRQLEVIVDAMLGPEGMGFRNLPKGLIPFHAYPDTVRTAAAEHLWEGAGYLAEPGGVGRYHFTVATEHHDRFDAHLRDLRIVAERELAIHFEIRLSTQSPATDTLAVDREGRVFRDDDGALLLRPAGHGALLANLAAVDAEVVFVKNIDNIAHRRLHPIAVEWKRILGGLFFELQTEIFELLTGLQSSEDPSPLFARARDLVTTYLAVEASWISVDLASDRQRELWIGLLDRPLRVCGVVENTAEPGGGPFWLDSGGRGCSGQIVESAQVDLTDPSQSEIWNASTHFNPVDLVCGLRDPHGRPYPLHEFVDPSTAIVARKSHHGRPLLAMERPGLWNGAMAEWNTAFVAVPLDTFTPVKTVFDLLRPEHQP